MGGETVHCVDEFCCLGYVLGSGGGAEEASQTMVKCGWKKFR
jgi:hypothetical protein